MLRCLGFLFKKNSNFPRNSRPNLAQYISERPELSSHGEKSKKAKQQQKKTNMKNYSTPLRLILRLLCVASIVVSAVDTFADAVIDWNIAMTSYSESLPPPGMPPYLEARVYAMAHIAMLRAITGNDADAARPFSKTAAIAQAAHDVLVDQFPGGASAFDNLLTKQLGAIADGPAKSAGVRLGARAAARQLALRANDGSATAEGPYVPGNQPGDYQFTPPFDGPPFNGYAAVPKWGHVKPFVMRMGDQFRAAPPYTVNDLEYTFDFNEIRALGSQNSDCRSADQTELALFC